MKRRSPASLRRMHAKRFRGRHKPRTGLGLHARLRARRAGRDPRAPEDLRGGRLRKFKGVLGGEK